LLPIQKAADQAFRRVVFHGEQRYGAARLSAACFLAILMRVAAPPFAMKLPSGGLSS
jgi:hypothetical protein